MENTRMDSELIKHAILKKLERNFGCELSDATDDQIYEALAQTVRDEVMQRRTASRGERKRQQAKKVYYLSAEFLVGRYMHNNMVALVNEKEYMKALRELGIDKSRIFEREPEPGLGNGGLGRLAACFLDSLTSMELPAMGCTIRYEYGLFRQKIENGSQVEMPDDWLGRGNIWEIPRPDQAVEVHFGGDVEYVEENGKLGFKHVNYTTVEAVPYDMPVLGYDTNMVNMLRCWSARSPKRLDMASFNRGQYVRAMAEKELAEVISKVLYPEDNHYQGKELRLKQQYFFSSASVQYAVNDFVKVYGRNWKIFPDKVALHVNDTHPGMAIPELMRILMDENGLGWDEAKDITRRTFAYTNHTVMPEALEKWPQEMIRAQLPRIYMILEEMNRRLCERLWKAYPGQWEKIGHMAIIGYGQVHMANLCVAMSHTVNGVSQIHADILRRQTFRDFYQLEPQKFLGITNGITHRRWLMAANPELTDLIDGAIGTKWHKEPLMLDELTPFAADAAFREEFGRIKRQNKIALADRMKALQDAELDPDTVFDVQAKRLHEYKRQLLNVLGIMMLYNRIDCGETDGIVPTTFIFGAKASPGYTRAKLIIRLINEVGKLVKRHPVASRYINVVFLENYCISAAEYLMPAAEVSEQLSTAGKEASGTGNMKFMMNGAVTIGTMDGANVEIFEQVGADNIYIFGMNADEVDAAYRTGGKASEIFETNIEIRKVMNQLIDGTLAPEEPGLFRDLYHALLFGDFGGMADPYFVLTDITDYEKARRRMAADYTDRDVWLKKAVINTAKSGIFSSDRTISEYAAQVWNLKKLDL